MSDGAAGSEGRRPKASKGGNRGNGHVCGAARYGDLNAARTAGGGRRCDAAGWQAVDREYMAAGAHFGKIVIRVAA